MDFEIIGEITNIETIARGTGVRLRRYLEHTYGKGRWRKMKFVICVSNNNPESLIIGRVYRTLPDEDAAKHNLIRVIDETYGEPGSEDGYLYPASMFAPIELPEVAERVLMTVGVWAQQPA